MHFTPATVAVGRELLSNPNTEHWAYAIAHNVALRYGTVIAVLHRMHDAGWLTVRVEPAHNAMPRRRLYHLTDTGRVALEHGIREAADKPPPTAGPRRGPRPHAPPQPPTPQPPALRPRTPRPTGTCPECSKKRPLRTDGFLDGHGQSGRLHGPRCAGSWEYPIEAQETVDQINRIITGKKHAPRPRPAGLSNRTTASADRRTSTSTPGQHR